MVFIGSVNSGWNKILLISDDRVSIFAFVCSSNFDQYLWPVAARMMDLAAIACERFLFLSNFFFLSFIKRSALGVYLEKGCFGYFLISSNPL